jgi:hypothetical protein
MRRLSQSGAVAVADPTAAIPLLSPQPTVAAALAIG